MKAVIIVGTSRKEGETLEVAGYINDQTGWPVIDLNDYQFSYYDYEHLNREDDFLPLMKDLISKYDTLLLATPVYWYNMSGIMKVFFDRLTDLITIEKDWGRKLRGKSLACVANSNSRELGEYFWMPFIHTAEYLGMHFLGKTHVYMGQGLKNQEKQALSELISDIEKRAKA